MKNRLLLVALSIILSACATKHAIELRENVSVDSDVSRVVIVADPQIHNIYGHTLKQQRSFSDVVSKVAYRPAELNILAPVVLEELVEKSLDRDSNNNLVVVLGDGTNVGCSGEYDEFELALDKQVGKTGKGLWVMAHGNHDSYMMGTTNGYVVDDTIAKSARSNPETSFWPPQVMKDGLPTDVSWWNHQNYASSKLNWRDSCFRFSETPDQYSPMNKIRWLARYLDHIERNIPAIQIEGIRQEKTSKHYNTYRIQSSGGELTNGGKFSIRGYWFEPVYTKDDSDEPRLPGDVSSFQAFESYIVQSIDIDANNRMLIIDTSVCDKARMPWNRPWIAYLENSGKKACIGDRQIGDIEKILENNKSDGKRTVIAGHFPFGDLGKHDQEALLGVLKSNGVKDNEWLYMSAHSHTPTRSIAHRSINEVNFGSTTDWPMQSAAVFFDKNGMVERENYFIDAALVREDLYQDMIVFDDYRPFIFSNGEPELCRHYATAKALEGFDPKDGIPWVSQDAEKVCINALESYDPSGNIDNPWKNYSKALDRLLADIRLKIAGDTEYKAAMMKIAATASKRESETWSIME